MLKLFNNFNNSFNSARLVFIANPEAREASEAVVANNEKLSSSEAKELGIKLSKFVDDQIDGFLQETNIHMEEDTAETSINKPTLTKTELVIGTPQQIARDYNLNLQAVVTIQNMIRIQQNLDFATGKFDNDKVNKAKNELFVHTETLTNLADTISNGDDLMQGVGLNIKSTAHLDEIVNNFKEEVAQRPKIIADDNVEVEYAAASVRGKLKELDNLANTKGMHEQYNARANELAQNFSEVKDGDIKAFKEDGVSVYIAPKREYMIVAQRTPDGGKQFQAIGLTVEDTNIIIPDNLKDNLIKELDKESRG